MYRKATLLSLVLLITGFIHTEAQRRGTTYQSLLQRTDQPSSYIDHIVTPVSDSTAQFSVFFRLDYDFIPFLRIRPDMNPPSPDAQYFAPVRMGVEVFEGSSSGSRRGSSQALSVFRDSWQDTVWVETFDETKDRFTYTQGFVSTVLPKGEYHYELQLTRGGSVRERSSSRRNFTIPNYPDYEETRFILLQEAQITGDLFSADLLNYGSNVLYGQDYSVLFKIPSHIDPDDVSAELIVERLNVEESETGEQRFSKTLTADDIIRLHDFNVIHTNDNLGLTAKQNSDGFRYVLVDIPNQDFENSRYKIEFKTEDAEKPVASRTVNSQWLDMPVSLYNLDVAVEMLKFIVSDQELNRINSGAAAEREKKFRDFWKQRDPTPDTEFNELMAEFYNRIDYAYKNFSSLQRPGFETDQGKAYIIYGPPLNVERRLPTNAPTREIWEYPNRTLIFEATTGFGDFRLISESS